MLGFEIKNLFKRKKPKEFLDNMKQVSIYTNSINEKKESLNELQFRLLKEKENEYFISLHDFLFFIENEEYSVEDMLAKFKHVGELTSTKFTYIDAYAIPMENGVLLTIEPLKDYKGDKVRLVSFKKV